VFWDTHGSEIGSEVIVQRMHNKPEVGNGRNVSGKE